MKKQHNFKLSDETVALIESVEAYYSLNKTQIVEAAILHYAEDLNDLERKYEEHVNSLFDLITTFENVETYGRNGTAHDSPPDNQLTALESDLFRRLIEAHQLLTKGL